MRSPRERMKSWLRRRNYDIGVRYYPPAEEIRRADPGRHWRVLDVGSGPDGISPFLQGRFVAGLDPQIDRAAAPSIPVVRASVLALPFQNESWDAVVCVDVLEHLSPAQRDVAFNELFRVTRSLLVLAFPCGNGARAADAELAGAYERRGKPAPEWLTQHLDNPLPEPSSLERLLERRVGVNEREVATRFNESLALQRSHRFLALFCPPAYVSWSLICGLMLPLLARPLSPQESYRIVWSIRFFRREG